MGLQLADGGWWTEPVHAIPSGTASSKWTLISCAIYSGTTKQQVGGLKANSKNIFHILIKKREKLAFD